MADQAAGSVGVQLELLFDGSSVAGMSDGQLLERFTARHDPGAEVAFEALFARHAPMVLGICRRILGDSHHAEDTFQAVFFILACKARSIQNPDLVATWLYGVALRTAKREKSRLDRRRKNEEGNAVNGRRAVMMTQSIVPPPEAWAMACEQTEILHDEIARLPGTFRLPVILCYFAGLTLDEAARRLRWPPGTVRSRLARARDKLRRGLTRRGVVLSGAALAVTLTGMSASAGVSTTLRAATTSAAIRFATFRTAGGTGSTAAASIAHGVLRSMLLSKLGLAAFMLLSLGAFVVGAAYLSNGLAVTQPKSQLLATGQRALAAANTDPPVTPKPAPIDRGAAVGRMVVSGRVLDPQGTPLPGAAVMTYAQLKQTGQPTRYISWSCFVTGRASCDGSGRFRIDSERTSSGRHDLAGVVAIAPGFGIGWVELDPGAEEPATDITLEPERAIHGRLFDLHGRPVPGVQVAVCNIRFRPADPESASVLRFDTTRAIDLAAWPKPATSDAEGRFALHGLGRGRRASLLANDPRFASQIISVATEGTIETSGIGQQPAEFKLLGNSVSAPITIALQPARILSGRITDAVTGRPIQNALIATYGASIYSPEVRTDARGRFRAQCSTNDQVRVDVYPPDGEPYLSARKYLQWPKGAVEQSLDLT
jgi:RNA polymerase sigma factor (sigma-70 family)